MSPLKPRNQGFIGITSSPAMRRRRFSTISVGLYWGIEVDQPVPIPSAPFMSTWGATGMYQWGSTFCPSSSK